MGIRKGTHVLADLGVAAELIVQSTRDKMLIE